MGASLVYLTEPNKDIEYETGSNDYINFAVGNMQGWRLNMEDAHIANPEFMNNPDKAVFGVFDGHGGREVAVYCNQNYEGILDDSKDEITNKGEQEWLRKSFLLVDDQLRTPEGQNALGDLRREKPVKKPPIMNILGETDKKDPKEMTNAEMMLDSIGCTSNVIYIDKQKKKIYVANAGDSRCVLGKNGKAEEMSIDHKPDCQIEIDRITKAGSVITEGRVDGNLNLTRSLGDLKYKHRTHLTAEEQAITANPDTYEFDLTNDIDFILMGCDGIWEKNSNEKAVAWCYEQINKQKEAKNISVNTDIDCQQIVTDLLNDNIAQDINTAEGVGCDNMTCILIMINKNKI